MDTRSEGQGSSKKRESDFLSKPNSWRRWLLICGPIAIILCLLYVLRQSTSVGPQDVAAAIERNTAEGLYLLHQGPFAEGWLKDVRDGHIDVAYEHTTSEFRRRMTSEQFTHLIEGHPVLHQAPTVGNFGSGGGMVSSGLYFTPPFWRVIEVHPKAHYHFNFKATEKETGKSVVVTIVKSDRLEVDDISIQ